MKIFSNLIRRTSSMTKRFFRTTHPTQMREWSRVSFFCSFGLMLFALILLMATSPGPLSVELSEDMTSTNAAFIDLVLFGAGGFFIAGLVLFVAAWPMGKLRYTKHQSVQLNPSANVLDQNTRQGKSELADILQKRGTRHE